jgi:hypothetical protein
MACRDISTRDQKYFLQRPDIFPAETGKYSQPTGHIPSQVQKFVQKSLEIPGTLQADSIKYFKYILQKPERFSAKISNILVETGETYSAETTHL